MRRLVFALPLFAVLASCNGPTDFYGRLQDVLQFDSLANRYFGVGDTLTIQGTLGGVHGGLTITIGGVNAPIIAMRDLPHVASGGPGVTIDASQQTASVVITEAMGLGANRPVVGTLHGVVRQAGLIFISLAKPVPPRKDTLNFDSTAFAFTPLVFGGNTLVARGDLGDGSVYILSNDSLELWKNGVRSLLHVGLADQYGPFRNIGAVGVQNNYMAVDEAGRYLYASLITSDTSSASATYFIFRLIKIDLQSYAVETLNRTPFPIDQTQVTPAYASGLTMTGPVGSVFLMPLSQIFPAADGTIYFVADGVSMSFSGPPWTTWAICSANQGYASAIGRIDPAGNVSYIIKSAGCGLPVATTAGPIDVLPSLSITHNWAYVDVIDPDSGVSYASGPGTTIQGVQVPSAFATIAYDLRRQRVLGSLAATPDGDGNPSATVTGPFEVVDGQFVPEGIVRGGGHRLWVAALQTAPASPTMQQNFLEIADFDVDILDPYVATTNVPQVIQDASSGGLQWTYAMPVIVNHFANGDPILAVTTFLGSGLANVFVPSVDAKRTEHVHLARRRP